MNEVRFRIAITAQEYLKYYQGRVDSVVVAASNGQKIQLPAGALVKFLDHKGIKGCFRVLFDNNNKLIRLERVSS
jgi:hypothetical protein